MPEKPNFRPEAESNLEVETRDLQEQTFEEVFFVEVSKKGQKIEYKSSAPDRKIIVLDETSKKPQMGVPYSVRVIQDTKPNNPSEGKLIVEIVSLSPNFKGVDTIAETEATISYLGVTLDKAQNKNSQFVPKREQFGDYINDNEVALPLQRDIAVSFLSGEPILIEGGTALGKTTTVKKMASELGYEIHYVNLNGTTEVEDLMGRYIPNVHKSESADPEYIFADGKVTSGLRQEAGSIKVIILDEFNAAAPNILIRLHEVLDALERGGEVVLSEDASEVVSVDKGKTKIIALMNPPGKGYFGRQPLDPAQLRRWVYKKIPSQLPEATFSYATDALFGATPELQVVTAEMLLPAREQLLAPEHLQEIPGMGEILEKYKQFHRAAKSLLESRKIAEDQPQTFTYDDRMEPRRVRDFILRFYNGDISETFQQALRYYYSNKLETSDDRSKLEELIKLVEYKPSAGHSKRKGLTLSTNKPVGTDTERTGESTEIETLLNLADQYRAMHDIWQEAKLTTYTHTAENGTTTPYEMPTLATVAEILERNQEIVKTKLAQGFTKLLIVPIGVKREELGNLLGNKLVELSEQGKLLRTKQNPTDPDAPFPINPEQPFLFWNDNGNVENDSNITYFTPDSNPTKQWVTIDTLVTTHNGWQVCLVEDRPNLPATADIATTLSTGGRTPLWAGMPPNEQLTKMGQGEYESEQGLTFAQWITLHLDHLTRTKQVIDDWQGQGKGSWLTGEKLTNGNVPRAGAGAGLSQANLCASSPSSAYDHVAARPSVVMKRA